ncbi:MAG: glycosyltransferase family 39 protein [Planctomycetota bacterium]|nr:glycosyltransferase family 39 protein [Planctomycetota bacterium]
MYERFTDRARKVIQLANQEAQRFNHEYIGTEHILLGLAKEGSGVAANVLKSLGVDLRRIRLEVEKLVKSGPEMITTGKLPRTPRAKKVVEHSMKEARNLNHNYVGTEHLLLGLLREQDGVAAQVLMNLGLRLDEVREEVLNLLGHGLEGEGGGREAGGGSAKSGKSKTPALDGFGRDHWQLLPILLLATLLRLWQIDESLWLDELHTAWAVSASPIEIVERAQIGNQSPLYFYLPWATTSLCGMSEWALRLPSLVAGIGLVAFAYGLTYQFTSSRTAASACAILAAMDHNFLFYATEARPYACVQLVAAVQLFGFWKLQESSTLRRRFAFVASSALLFYLHYTAILLVAGEVVYLFAWRRANASEYSGRKLAIDLLCVAALMLPAAVHVFDIGTRRNAWATLIKDTSWLPPVHWFSLVSYVAVPSSICLVGVLVRRMRRDSEGRRFEWRLAYLLACWLGVPLGVVWLLTVTKLAPLYLGRYVIGAALAPVLFAGLCVGVWENRRSRLVVAGVFIAFTFSTSGMIQQLRNDGRLFGDRAENWRDAVAYVNDWTWDKPVFVRSGLLEADRLVTDDSEMLRAYCVLPVTSIYRIDRPDSEIRPLTTRGSGTLTEEDVRLVEASGSAWFIINGSTATRERCAERILDSLKKNTPLETQHGLILDERQFGQVGIFLVIVEIDDQVDSPRSDAPTTSQF